MKRKIAMLIDQKWRDLPGLVWLKLLLEQEADVEVRLFPFGSEQAYMPGYRPHVAVFNNLLDKSRVLFARRLKKQRTRIVVLPTEGIPTLNWQLDEWSGITSDWRDIDLYMTWNNVLREHVLKLGTLPSDRVCTIGIPRFDFYRKPLREAAMSRDEYGRKFGIDMNCPTVLWPTNFTLAGFESRNQELWRSIHKEMHWDVAYPDLKAEDLPRIDGLTRRITRDCLKQLRGALPDINLAIKPHPNEDVSFWMEFIREMNHTPGRGRAVLIWGVYIWDALSCADVVVQRSCTTAAEAWFMGIPSIEARLNAGDFYYSKKHASGSEEVTSAQDLISLVKSYCDGIRKIPAELKEAQAAFEKKWCTGVDGQRTRVAADHILTIARQALGFIKPPWPHPRYISQCSKANIKRCFGHKPHELLTWDYIFRLKKKPVGTDILGRYDRYVDTGDIVHWENKLRSFLKQ